MKRLRDLMIPQGKGKVGNRANRHVFPDFWVLIPIGHTGVFKEIQQHPKACSYDWNAYHSQCMSHCLLFMPLPCTDDLEVEEKSVESIPADLMKQTTLHKKLLFSLPANLLIIPKGQCQRKFRCLLERLRDFKNDILRFAKDWRIPYTYNNAERAIHCARVKEKVSGCFRTKSGADDFALVLGFIFSTALHGVSSFDAIIAAFRGNAVGALFGVD